MFMVGHYLKDGDISRSFCMSTSVMYKEIICFVLKERINKLEELSALVNYA